MIWPRRILGTLINVFTPSYSACYHCRMPWNVVRGHTTYYSRSQGCFPLCEYCWARLTPAERLHYYARLYVDWGRAAAPEDWDAIEAAVLAGK